MSNIIDIRESIKNVEVIRFSDTHTVEKVFGGIEIQEELSGTLNTVLINDKKEAEDLILSLEKAIDLNFFD